MFSGKYIILCILKGEMPIKMQKLPEFFFFLKCVPTLPKILRPITRNTLIFFIWPSTRVTVVSVN